MSTHHGNNYLPLLEQYYRSHRPALCGSVARIGGAASVS
jgi:hypothetical protein